MDGLAVLVVAIGHPDCDETVTLVEVTRARVGLKGPELEPILCALARVTRPLSRRLPVCHGST